jgi:Zn-dependent peptidase ImmA (M78 family)
MKKLIQKYVIDLLQQNKITAPPINVDKIAESLNISVKKHPYDEEHELSAMLIRDGGNVIIGVNSNHSEQRQRFSIAHEIGHFLLHEGDKLIVDRQIKYQVNFRNKKSSLGIDINEIEANRFASALLMPEHFINKDLEKYEIDIDDKNNMETICGELAQKYNVSLTSMMLKISSKLH